MELQIAKLEEFKNLIYPEYLNLFPKLERREYSDIEKSVKKGKTRVIKIIVEKEMVGFMITNKLKDISCLQLDYLAILPKYQKKGYGSDAINLLKKDSDSIFIEIEKQGLGKNEKENIIRERRAKFYEKLGFKKLSFDIVLNTIVFSTYLLKNSDIKASDVQISKSILKNYEEIIGKEKVIKNFKIVFNK